MGVNLVTGFLETLQTSLGHFALAFGGVSGGALLALLLNLSSAVDNIILDFVLLLLGPALGLVLSAADLGSLDVAILDQRSSADLHSLVEGNLLVLDETALPEILLALLLLLGVVVGDVGGVAPLVVAVVTLDHVIVLNLLNHLDLVNTSLAVGSGRNSGHISETGGSIGISLTLSSGRQILSWSPGGVISVSMGVVVVVVPTRGIERKGVHQGLAISCSRSSSAELTSAKSTGGPQQCNNEKLVHFEPVGDIHEHCSG